MPANVFVPATSSGLPKDSVVNVTDLVTLDKSDLGTEAGQLPPALMNDVDRGLHASWGSNRQARACRIGRLSVDTDQARGTDIPSRVAQAARSLARIDLIGAQLPSW
jgi:PemK-like, MazF-like toxin of type II toxin-antitoxin system